MKHKFTIRLLMLILIVSIVPQQQSCKKIDLKREILLQTGVADSVTFNTAMLTGEIVDGGERGSFSEYGFVYSPDGNPTIENSKIIVEKAWKTGVFTFQIDGLESNTTFYFKSYVLISDSVATYGNVNSFKTEINPSASSPTVLALQVTNITSQSAGISGEVTSDGGASVTRKGFCISAQPLPNINDDDFSEDGQGIGTFNHSFVGLQPLTQYYVRAYAENQIGIAYSGQLDFTTTEDVGVVTEWLHYDDGINVDGIGLTNGGSFDVAIRFTPEQLAPYNGFRITKVSFFPMEGYPIEYSIEILTGSNPTYDDLAYEQLVENLQIETWNEVALDISQTIDASQELWVGYYMSNQQAGTYPAGIDDGPGVNGFGNMISTDNFTTWITLADEGIDANWNIQVFVTNEAGKEIPMPHPKAVQPLRNRTDNNTAKKITSQNSVK